MQELSNSCNKKLPLKNGDNKIHENARRIDSIKLLLTSF